VARAREGDKSTCGLAGLDGEARRGH